MTESELTKDQRAAVGRARRYGTTHARQDRDEDRPRNHRKWSKSEMVLALADLQLPSVKAEFVTRVHDAYVASYITRWQLIGNCEHEFKQKGERHFGVSDGARCINCGVSVMHQSTLDIPDLTEKD
jgi:hypothetical protein